MHIHAKVNASIIQNQYHQQQPQQHNMQRRKPVTTPPVGSHSNNPKNGTSDLNDATSTTNKFASFSRTNKVASGNIRKNRHKLLGNWFFAALLMLLFLVFVIVVGIRDRSVESRHQDNDSVTKNMMRGSVPTNDLQNDRPKVTNDLMYDFKNARDKIRQIRQEFYDRYGGQTEAMSMLKRGIIPASSMDETSTNRAMRHTAERILLAAQNVEKRFVMSFGGYSVTVGRGNYYHQSYPFVMEKVLQPLFKDMDLELIVRNSAIGGIPSFPYGWCLPNFFG
jgi:hypothetical protein